MMGMSPQAGYYSHFMYEETGIQIIRRAIEEPLRQIVENAGLEGSVVVNEVRNGKGDYGYNARVDKYENLKADGALVVLNENDKNVVLSGRNIDGVQMALTNTINVFDILNHKTLVLTKDAAKTIEEVYA